MRLTEVNCWRTLKGSSRNCEVVRGGIVCGDKASEEVVRGHLLDFGRIRGGAAETGKGIIVGGENGVVS